MSSTTTTFPLRELVEKFSKGQILLPQFQRDYVWKPAKIRNLLDSLLKGFPIGGFYFWRPAEGAKDPKTPALGKHKISPEFFGYLIDGQQRLTSLEAAFDLYTGEDKDGSVLRCFLDLDAQDGGHTRDTRLFVSYGGNQTVAWRADNADPTLIPLHGLFSGMDFDLRSETEKALESVPGWNKKRIGDALDRFDKACKMLDQPVPCTTISNVEDRDAVEVFSRLNKGGAALRQGDVRAAELARGHAVDVLKTMRQFVAQELPQRLGFGFSFAFRTLVVFHRETAQFNKLKEDWIETAGPHGRSLRDSWRATERAIDHALAFADKRMGWSRRALLPSANALIVLAAALDKADFKVEADSERFYRRWLCLTALRGVFQGSVETTINRFYRAIKESKKNPAKALVKALRKSEGRRIRADEFIEYGHPWGPATQVMHAWLTDKDAKDWLSGEAVDGLARTGSPTRPGGDLTVHHIFPRKVLSAVLENPRDANRPANYALLSRATNSEFGDKCPDEVWATLTSDERKTAAAQLFGDAAGDQLKPDRYEGFCQWRADRLAESINDWLGM
jgi:hypothetical protein